VNVALLTLVIALAGQPSAQPDEQPVATTFAPYIGVGYGHGSLFATETNVYSYEEIKFSGLNLDLGTRLTLVSGQLHAYAQADFINLDQLFPRESMVAFMVTQTTGWSADILTLEAGFRYARTFDRNRLWSGRPVDEMYGGFVGARQIVNRFDYGLTLGLIHRNGLITDETELPAWIDVTYHLGVIRPGIGLGWTTRKVWSYERVDWNWAVTDHPLYISVGVCFVPFGEASDFPARMLMPRDVSYYQD
jgi:hypothetical protein